MKYIAFYDLPQIKNENRYVNAAARGVIEYMIQMFSEIEPVEVISPGRTLSSKRIYRGKTLSISDNAVLKIPFTFGVRTRIGRILSLMWTQLWLFTYLLCHTKRNEKVVFYHSLSLMTIISVLYRLKGIQPILEFREIYSDINKVSKRLTKKEHQYFNCAYGFIFPSDAIRRILNVNNKPYVLAPGSYSVHRFTEAKFSDGKIHCVYAGNLRRDKGGAFIAIEAAKFLDERFVIHILGSGNDNQIKDLQIEIDKEKTKANIVYDGFLTGEGFYRFLGSCKIGLATQQPGVFSNTSFPSKILTYMGCGLAVVCPDLETVRLSPIAEFMNMYREEDYYSIAEQINIAAEKTVDYSNVLSELDKKLKQELQQILS